MRRAKLHVIPLESSNGRAGFSYPALHHWRQNIESFDFRFSGVQGDRTKQALFARARHGEQIAVARIQGSSTCGSVDLAAGAKIYLLKESGRVTAILTATDHPRPGLRWIQMDDNWSLRNLLADLFRRPRDSRS